MIEFNCTCERGTHRAPLEEYIIERGALKKLPAMLSEYKKIFMVCDENTYAAAGETVEKLFAADGRKLRKHVFKKGLLPNTEAIGDLLVHINDVKADSDIFSFSPLPDLMLAVGSGTVNDITRFVSYRLGIPYAVAGTAPSMDGYASAGSPLLFDGSKATVKCTTPRYFVADLDVMAKAPYDMLLAGIGDMFGKYTGILDWELAKRYRGEYYCDKIANDVIDATNKCLQSAYELEKRDTFTVGNIVEGFIVTGLGMAYIGNSRPASGAEHIIAHAWELYEVEAGKPASLHGLCVAEATLIIAFMYRLLYRETDDDDLETLIEKYLPYFSKVEEFCIKECMPMPVKDRALLHKSIERALGLRDRYTILFYLNDRGLLQRYTDHALNELHKLMKFEK